LSFSRRSLDRRNGSWLRCLEIARRSKTGLLRSRYVARVGKASPPVAMAGPVALPGYFAPRPPPRPRPPRDKKEWRFPFKSAKKIVAMALDRGVSRWSGRGE